MTISSPPQGPQGPEGRGGASAPPRPATPSPDVPVRAEGLQLIGEMQGSGYRTPPALVRRGDGQMIQLTPLLYLVLDAVDGRRTHEEIAEQVSQRFGRLVSAENIETLVDGKLRPLGVLLKGDGSEPELKKSNPLLGLRHRVTVTDPVKTQRLTDPFARLFNPVLVTVVTAAFLYITWWLLLHKGLASATHEAFHKPGLLLLIFVVTVLSAGFHEFGHAAAARRGGSTPGAMGAGLYLFWPAFYTDVTDSYRLGRVGRLRTDLGGLYFNAIVAVGIVGAWLLSGYDALLLVVATQILQILRQLTPIIRFDGYHVLADLTGVPDLYHRIKPTLLGLLPWRWHDPEVSILKPWARAVVTIWVLLVVPMLAFSLVTMVLTLPRMIATAWVSLLEQKAALTSAFGEGDVVMVMARLLAIVCLVLPIAGIAYILTRLVRQGVTSVLARTEGKPVRRGIAGLLAIALVAGLGWAWWPRGDTYRPIAAYERGTLGQALPLARSAPATEGLREGSEGTIQSAWPAGSPMPTKDDPGLALIMVPHPTAGGTTETAPTPVVDPSTSPSSSPSALPSESPSDSPGAVLTEDPSASPTDAPSDGSTAPAPPPSGDPGSWVFPFDQPLPPEEGDTQALAVNTTDGTVAYDVAFALVWADGDTVTNTNEAVAAASCTGCAAVAVSFQVVLVMNDADVIVPQNLATSATYNCVACLTYALASQLVITLDGPLSDAGMAALQAVWEDLAVFAQNITSVPLSELQGILEDYQQQITQIIQDDEAATPLDPGADPSASPSPTESPSGSVTPTESPSATPSESVTPSATPTETVPTSPSSSPTPTESPSATPTESPSATPTESPSAAPASATPSATP
ncbi:hypothetical protein H5V45_13150 [Nocardioides sp. KIGAM211]|uniref:Peptide zinc metalloprotease protein n=1 Tax=Nocardioides luti TaxID=2761101 RepID=A0A7X0RH80_9ACTN|nr:hypothetical protein [Nocardioides luti]MBB6628269.1 hypothetical protein [Nocardioides luti]